MRLFVAITLPEKVKKQLGNLEKPIEGVRWQDSTQMHLTLRFIGSVDNEISEEVQKRLAKISHQSFKMDINGLGQFPERGKPRVLWAGVKEQAELMKLQEKVEEACVNSGLETEDRDYKPHITIAKVKNNKANGAVKLFIDEYKNFSLGSIPVNEFTLFNSKLSKEGAIHIPIEKYKLN